ncbi:MAG: CesT family type III secretion system chaperone [Pseudomonadota bacterium]
MSKEKYCELIDQLCKKLGIEDSKSMYNACNVEVGNIPFTLLHGGNLDQDSLYLYCNFGEPPSERKTMVLQRLLETNLCLFGHNAQNFGFNVETGRVLQMSRMSVSQTKVESLMQVLGGLAAYAQMWRQSAFLPILEIEQAFSTIQHSQFAA